MIEIERYGERLIGCIDCNCWQGRKSAFIVDLSVEDIQALRALVSDVHRSEVSGHPAGSNYHLRVIGGSNSKSTSG